MFHIRHPLWCKTGGGNLLKAVFISPGHGDETVHKQLAGSYEPLGNEVATT